jgi:HEAT repeat protein
MDLDAMLNVLASPAPHAADRTATWTSRAAAVERILSEALAGSPSARAAALAALDSRDDGPGLGALAPEAKAAVAPAGAAALRRLGAALRGRVAVLLTDGSPDVRSLALRVDSKLGDPALKPAVIVATLGTVPGSVRDAAVFALRQHVAAHPDAAPAATRALAAFIAEAPASWERRLVAVDLLLAVGAPARPLLEEQAARDASPFVRSAAVLALGTLGGPIAPLVAASTDPTPAVRAAAARALSRLPGTGSEATLARLAHDPSELVRSSLDHIEP